MKTIKTIKTILLLLFAISISSCDLFWDEEDEEIFDEEYNFFGLYEKDTGGVYLKITDTKGYLCSSSNEYSGDLDGNTIYFEVGNEIVETQLRNVGNNIEVRQLINNNYNEWTLYIASSDLYPCDNNGNNGNPGGDIVFYTSSDLGCGPITVNLVGVGSGTMNVYFPNQAPSCGSGGAVTFNDVPAGNYQFTASCTNYNWSANVQIFENTCTQQRLSSNP